MKKPFVIKVIIRHPFIFMMKEEGFGLDCFFDRDYAGKKYQDVRLPFCIHLKRQKDIFVLIMANLLGPILFSKSKQVTS